jgi:hypothetical protein
MIPSSMRDAALMTPIVEHGRYIREVDGAAVDIFTPRQDQLEKHRKAMAEAQGKK